MAGERPAGRSRRGRWAALAAAGLTLAACGGPPAAGAPPTTAPRTPAGPVSAGSPVAQPAPDGAGTTWLCRPGQSPDPCTTSLATTVVPGVGPRSTTDPRPDPAAPADCFYVYPTVSTEAGENADLTVQAAEVQTAEAQAARFSPVCRVWAPMYRQVTVAGLFNATQAAAGLATAYQSLLAAWQDYLANDNGGRPIAFLGHSQGASMLIRLLQSRVDPDPALRARTVVAVLAGGNVVVPTGAVVGGSFAHLPLCRARGQGGCVIAYSAFPGQPPPQSLFGRPGQGVSLLSGQTASSGLEVACTDPAALGGGTADLGALFRASQSSPTPPVTTPWVAYPDLYTSTCRSGAGAAWLEVGTAAAAGRPTVAETLGPDWGYHLDDVALPLGDLVTDVAAAERALPAGG